MPTKSAVQLSDAGYVEMTFVGTQNAAIFKRLVIGATKLLAAHGPAQILVDLRRGLLARDIPTLQALQNISNIENLTGLVMLVTPEYAVQMAKGEKTLIPNMVSVSLGLQPYYTMDEKEARSKAAEKVG